jgi:hypothetical protein
MPIQNIRIAVRTTTDHYNPVKLTFNMLATFGSKPFEDRDGIPFNWGVSVFEYTNFEPYIAFNGLTKGSDLIAHSATTDEVNYNVDSSIFTLNSYYQIYSWLDNANDPTKPHFSVISTSGINLIVFKYIGTFEDKGSTYLEFETYKYNGDLEEWVLWEWRDSTSTVITSVYTMFSTF